MTEPSGWTTVIVDAEDEEVTPGARFWVQTDEVVKEEVPQKV
jgi:hypothetical protein